MPNIRKSNEAHRRDGTFRKDRHVADDEELIIKDELPLPPDWITCNQIANDEWQRITKVLDQHSVLKATDYAAVCSYCKLFAMVADSEVSASVFTQLRGLLNDLGLTPVSRNKIKVPLSGKKASAFSDL